MTSSKTSTAPRHRRCAQRLEKARLGDDAHVPGDGLDDDGRQPLAVRLDRRADALHVVEAADDRVDGSPDGTPGEDGILSVATPEPAAASSPSAWPW